MNGGFVKIYGSIVLSSVWAESKDTKILWVTMLATADPTGFVEGSIGGLARIAGLTREECVAALDALMQPDPDSKTPDNEGRRIAIAPRGWRILNYELYREMRTRSQDDAARRKREQRERERDTSQTGVTVTPVTDASPSSSASPSESLGEVKSKDSIQGERPGVARLAAFMAAHDFGKLAPIVEGFLRSQRNSIAVIATLEMHLAGEMGHEKATAEQLALAVQQYAASAEPQFKAMLFAGFVRKAKSQPERTARRAANAAEEAHIIAEKREAEQREQDTRDQQMLNDFERTNEEKFMALKAAAEKSIDARYKGDTRAEMVRGALIRLVQKEVR